MKAGTSSISNQEYHNPAYVPDTPVDNNEPTDATTLPNDPDGAVDGSPPPAPPEGSDVGKPAPPVGECSRRASSIADIAFALNPSLNSSRHSSLLSLTELVGPKYFRRSNYFRHPFGDSVTVIEEIFSLDKQADDRYIQSGTESPAKLVIWIVFTLFMIAVAGAIILGAESYERQRSNRNGTYPLCNGSEIAVDPG